jgi:hypothetical protein
MVDRTGQVVHVAERPRGGREAAGPRKVRNLPPSSDLTCLPLPRPPQGRFADLVTLLMWLWLWLAVLRCLGDRLAADSPLLLLDVDVVHTIASVLSQPCCITLAGVRDAAAAAATAATDMAAVPTIAEIVWPGIGGREQEAPYQEDTMFDDDLNTPVYESFDTRAVLQLGGGGGAAWSLNLGSGHLAIDPLNGDIGLDGGLDDDDIGL